MAPLTPLTFIAFADGQASPHHCLRYANTLARAVAGQVVQLRVSEPSVTVPGRLMAEPCAPDDLLCQATTAAELASVAQELRARCVAQVIPDLPPALVRELADRHHPLVFVLSQRYPDDEGDESLATTCAKLLQTSYPVLVVPLTAPAGQVPRRILIAADREPFRLAANSQPLRQLLALPHSEILIVHVAGALEDGRGYDLAEKAVLGSGLVEGLPAPELRGYEHGSYPHGLLAAVRETRADLVVVLARQRSYLSELFHRSVTVRLLENCPVPVLVLPTAPGGFE
ncbi:hypothetical protein BEN47_14895 [Hymenobacter lapidarius]|uniref:UspA domain-containing protein n=1 Tax=Hymenobacter lapidarius TaxID=1908237 RepID=A0A1G1T3E6_9BACT|nr:universal stress protein [Hymenobacter lapidarius]OGX85400.1 hypothetical protein BEN47_14895 [Hymenobacter lapidarius]